MKIAEFFGGASCNPCPFPVGDISVAHVHAKAGWAEDWQTPAWPWFALIGVLICLYLWLLFPIPCIYLWQITDHHLAGMLTCAPPPLHYLPFACAQPAPAARRRSSSSGKSTSTTGDGGPSSRASRCGARLSPESMRSCNRALSLSSRIARALCARNVVGGRCGGPRGCSCSLAAAGPPLRPLACSSGSGS